MSKRYDKGILINLPQRISTMQLTLEAQHLHDAVSSTFRFIPSKPLHPVMSCFLFDIRENEAFISAFDLSKGIKLRLNPIEAKGQQSFCVPAKSFSNFISKLDKNSEVTLEIASAEISSVDIKTDKELKDNSKAAERYNLASKDMTLKVISSTGPVMEFLILSAAEFPDLPIPKANEDWLEIPWDKAIAASYAYSDDATKLQLGGSCLKRFGSDWRIAATDGHRLGMAASFDLADKSKESVFSWQCIIPQPAIAAITGCMLASKQTSAWVSAEEHGTHCFVRIGEEAEVYVRAIDGQYPQYEQLVPASFNVSLDVNRKLLLASLDRIEMVAAEGRKLCMLKLSQNTLTLCTTARSVGYIEEKIAVIHSGEDFTVFFNPAYVLDAIKAIGSDVVSANFTTPTRPMIFCDKAAVSKHLVMPVQARDDANFAPISQSKKKSSKKSKPKQKEVVTA